MADKDVIRDFYNKVFGKPKNELSRILREKEVEMALKRQRRSRSFGGGGREGAIGEDMAAIEAQRRAAEKAALEAQRRAAEKAALEAQRKAAEKIAQRLRESKTLKSLRKARQFSFLPRKIIDRQVALEKSKQIIEKIKSQKGKIKARIVPIDMRSDLQQIVSELEETRRKQEKIQKERLDKKMRPLTKSEKKSLKSIGSILEESRRASLRSKKGVTTKEGARLVAGGFVEAVLGGVIGVKELPKTLNYLRKNPREIKKIPSSIAQSAKEFSSIARISPQRAVGRIGGEVLLLKGSGTAIKGASKISEKQLTKLLPSYVGEAKVGKKLKIPVGKDKIELEVVNRIPVESIEKQLKRAGKKTDIAISSQAQKLLGSIINRERMIKKPLGKTKLGKEIEKALGKREIRLLEKLDAGKKLSRNEILRLNKAVRGLGSKGILERAFFADPSGKIRPSRLGVIRDEGATLKDYLSRNVQLRKSKPQILLFRDVMVEKFPDRLKPVVKKLASGKRITEKENADLLKFQLTKSGKFKPLGFATRESEIAIAPGEIIKRVKKRGTTIVNGRRVQIVEVKVGKITGKTKKLLDDFKKGKLNKKQVKSLDSKLKKDTGLNYNLSKKYSPGKKYVDIKTPISTALSSAVSRIKKSTRPYVRSPTKKSPRSPVKPSPRSPTKPYRRIPLKIPSPVSRPPSSPKRYKKKVPATTTSRYLKETTVGERYLPGKKIGLIRGVADKKVKSKRLGFNLFVKSRGKFIKLNKLPLSKKDAIDKRAYVLDNTVSRTARVIPTGSVKKFGTIKTYEKGYASKLRRKFRDYKIRKGEKDRLRNTKIERKKFAIDTKGEKRQLSIARKIKSKKR